MTSFIFNAAFFVLGASTMQTIVSLVEGNFAMATLSFVVAILSLGTIDVVHDKD